MATALMKMEMLASSPIGKRVIKHVKQQGEIAARGMVNTIARQASSQINALVRKNNALVKQKNALVKQIKNNSRV